jgi:hypothetical protein
MGEGLEEAAFVIVPTVHVLPILYDLLGCPGLRVLEQASQKLHREYVDVVVGCSQPGRVPVMTFRRVGIVRVEGRAGSPEQDEGRDWLAFDLGSLDRLFQIGLEGGELRLVLEAEGESRNAFHPHHLIVLFHCETHRYRVCACLASVWTIGQPRIVSAPMRYRQSYSWPKDEAQQRQGPSKLHVTNSPRRPLQCLDNRLTPRLPGWHGGVAPAPPQCSAPPGCTTRTPAAPPHAAPAGRPARTDRACPAPARWSRLRR